MEINNKKLLVVGDRVLVTPEKGQDRTRVGLYLPPAAVEKMTVQAGRIAEVGPGTPVPSPGEMVDEPWKTQESRQQFISMEARVGDLVLFLRNAAVEIEFDNEKYLIVPQGAMLLLVRDAENDVKDSAETEW
jgi:co-chaperonin GroES (HSP10)